jgi:hypothetical protein
MRREARRIRRTRPIQPDIAREQYIYPPKLRPAPDMPKRLLEACSAQNLDPFAFPVQLALLHQFLLKCRLRWALTLEAHLH